MATIERIGKTLLIRSNQLVEGNAKLPTTSQIEVGELAINYHKGYETISTVNDNNEIATFSSDSQVKDWLAHVSGLPAVTTEDNGKILIVSEGEWILATPSTIYTGSGTPAQNLGKDGDIFLQTL